ncbi:FAD-dependent oxidoreductase [Nonomuraea sp. NPDC003201]
MEHTYDVVVVGSGAAGLTAALTARLHGLTAIVIEKTGRYGGSSAISGGALWIPGNHYLDRRGIGDSRGKAEQYLEATVGDRVPAMRRSAYLDRGPEMLRFLHDRTRHVRFEYVRGYADYYPERPGGFGVGRAIEPPLFDLRKLGPLRRELRRAELPTYGMVVKAQEAARASMVMRTWGGKLTAVKLGLRAIGSLLTGARPVALGAALVARLRAALGEAGGEVWVSTPFTGLLVEDDRVGGVTAMRAGRKITIRASRGVVLASGGFSHSQELRERYLPAPTDAGWSSAAEGQTGDAIGAALKLGAALDLMDKVWGMPAAVPPGEKPVFLVTDRAVPGMIIVNGQGERYVNEALPYAEFVDRMYADDAIPSWMIFDGRTKNRYLMLNHFPGQPFKRRWIRSGFIKVARNLHELADQTGLPADRLMATMERFNAMAAQGKDEDFGRGDSAYDNYYGDPTLPNPNLAPLVKPPFYAVRLVPGDIGTKGGLVTDERARVLREDDTVIEGLYAAGNAAASVMGETYPGPGATLGPAMTFGYVAAGDLAVTPSSR